jgi:hypothetical protein
MKKLITLLALVITLITNAQAPQGFNYQATVRNSAGALIISQNVIFKFKVLQNSATGTIVYSENQSVTTDDLGQVNLVIGQGTATVGTFSTINWGTGNYYLGIELNTGSGYVAMGTTQLLSVPYALYANSAGNSQTATPNLASVLAVNNGANNLQIKNLANPIDAQDAVTKAYTQNLVAQINQIPSGNNTGDILYWNGTNWISVNQGTNGQVLTLVNNIPKWQTLNSTNPPNSNTYLGYILPEPQDAASQNAIGLWTYNAGGNFNGFGNTGLPNVNSYANDMAIYAQYPGWFGNSGNFITNVSTLSNSIRQATGSGADSNGCLIGQYKLGSVGITSTNVNPSIQYSYTIWIPLAGVGGIFTNMNIDAGTGGSPCSTNISNGAIPEPGYAAINVTVPNGCAIPAGIYRVLWLSSLYNFPPTTPLQSNIWIKGN